jgi:hypothetical protein
LVDFKVVRRMTAALDQLLSRLDKVQGGRA